MSAIIETFIVCDGNSRDPKCSNIYANGDGRSSTAAGQRQRYRADGWRFINGKDYCPRCYEMRADKNVERARAQRLS